MAPENNDNNNFAHLGSHLQVLTSCRYSAHNKNVVLSVYNMDLIQIFCQDCRVLRQNGGKPCFYCF